MSKIWVKPTGNIIKGHVLDVAVGPLVERLRDYDSQLYVRWNPRKLRGWGCWEIRRKPEELKVKDVAIYGGNTYVKLDYVEINLVHHILDVPFLNYSVLTKLKEMDRWVNDKRGADFSERAEYYEAKYYEKLEDKAEEDRAYAIKQHKSQIRDFKEYILSGGNPYRLADVWNKV